MPSICLRGGDPHGLQGQCLWCVPCHGIGWGRGVEPTSPIPNEGFQDCIYLHGTCHFHNFLRKQKQFFFLSA